MTDTTISIRKAIDADLTAIVAMLADDALGATREDNSSPLNQCYIDAFKAIDNDPNQLLAVVEHDGIVVGCLQLSFIPGLSRKGMWRGQIESVRITSDIRGGGIGRQMIEWAIEQCRKRNCGLVQLTTDKSRADAIRFYKSLGFVDSHEGMKLSL
ncbi:N-acetyltransferase [Ochrobactrum sp. MYb15]|uniref:GNAT family N-acetyltransferase n=1 Tax=Brucella TaxID=234 RepID=UPI0004638A57|nr:GNAT family N-acetyltransferase [Brucella rhizosphaerae]PQZ50565.1 N-acetyltransferase [Ochrobactrum sp. MYb19]PRA55534.1 N-acetyltransferase [Ochrobactrum sp. MYb68]PRA68604.1 N-acetyltransferase [Ochrobactrum sp. MYb18]PRA74168.1 N-acetyltransferase [Brucella thiophenivorans]PRA90856.1 N-acetyltransferase [Ochrobactrum sp. MYb14]PRA96307.1 N-acetyltransferase [Ochrobactrum sp. MYb15]